MGLESHDTSSDSGQNSDDEAPEVITASQSKAKAREQEHILKISDARIKQQRKEANRQRDQILKRRAEETKGPSTKRSKVSAEGKGNKTKRDAGKEHGEMSRAEERMRKAMLEAEDEDEDEEGGSLVRLKHKSNTGSDEEDVPVEDVYKNVKGKTTSLNTKAPKEDYLPDDVFAAAFKVRQSEKDEENLSKSSSLPLQSGITRKKRRTKAKDLIIGSATIKVQPKPTPLTRITARSTQSAKMNRFVKDSLGLRGRGVSVKHKGWERRPANIGVLSGSGPAAHFTRNQ